MPMLQWVKTQLPKLHGTPPSCHNIPNFLLHFRLYEVLSIHVCFLPYKYRKILEMLPKPMGLCGITGSRPYDTNTMPL